MAEVPVVEPSIANGRSVTRTALDLEPAVPDAPRGVAQPLRWPGAHAMLSSAFDVGPARRLKYLWRLLVTRQARARLLMALSDLPAARVLFVERPRVFYPLMNHLLDRRFDASQRLRAMLQSWHAMQAAAQSAELFERLVARGIELLRLPGGVTLVLSLNGVSFHEGLWQLAAVGADGSRIYSLGFGFTGPRTILVGNIQGPSTRDAGPSLIRALTHSAEGLRPPWLLLGALRLLARCRGVTTLLGIDPGHHVKGRWNVRRNRLRFDYVAFWVECGGVRHLSGNWKLPVEVEARALADVPARRRAMYRRRHEMLERLEGRMVDLFGSEGVEASERNPPPWRP